MKILSTSNIHQGPVKMLIYGASGVGKTSLVKTLEGKTLIVSAESGLLSLTGTNHDFIDITRDDEGRLLEKAEDRFKRFAEVYVFLQTKEAMAKYQNVFIDSLTEISEALSRAYKDMYEGTKSEGFKQWGDYTAKLTDYIKKLRDLPHYNVVILCLEELDKDEGGRRFFGPDIPGNAAKQFLLPAFDLVFRAYVENGERFFQTALTEKVKAKSRGVALQPVEPMDLGKIMGKIRGQETGRQGNSGNQKDPKDSK